jgi:hypothetical protein
MAFSDSYAFWKKLVIIDPMHINPNPIATVLGDEIFQPREGIIALLADGASIDASAFEFGAAEYSQRNFCAISGNELVKLLRM